MSEDKPSLTQQIIDQKQQRIWELEQQLAESQAETKEYGELVDKAQDMVREYREKFKSQDAEIEDLKLQVAHWGQDSKTAHLLMKDAQQDLTTANQRLGEISKVLFDGINSVENILALMSEGEGRNPKIYQDMAKMALRKVRELKSLELKGGGNGNV